MRIHRAITICLATLGVLAGSFGLSATAAFGFFGHPYLSQFTEAPDGAPVPGSIENPRGLAIGPSGDLLIVDTYKDLIDVFNPANEFQTQVQGLLYNPEDVAFDGATGDLYTTQEGGEVIVSKPLGAGGYTQLSHWNKVNTYGVAVDNSTSALDPRAGDVYVEKAEVVGVEPSGQYKYKYTIDVLKA